MTTTTDLSPERLDELEGDYVTTDGTVDVAIDDLAALITMARAKQAAERGRDALRDVLRLIAEREPMCDYDWAPCDAARAALAQYTDAGGDDEPLLQAEWKPTTRKVRMRLNHLPAGVLHPTPLDWPSDDAGGA